MLALCLRHRVSKKLWEAQRSRLHEIEFQLRFPDIAKPAIGESVEVFHSENCDCSNVRKSNAISLRPFSSRIEKDTWGNIKGGSLPAACDSERLALLSTISVGGPNLRIPEALQLNDSIHKHLLGAMQVAIMKLSHVCQLSKAAQVELSQRRMAQKNIAFENSNNLVPSMDACSVMNVFPMEKRSEKWQTLHQLFEREVMNVDNISSDVRRPASLKLRLSQKERAERETRLQRIRKRHAKFYQNLERQKTKEMEAYQNAANEYKELLNEMGEKKLGPSLPVGKALILSWFEPLKDAIAEEFELMKLGKFKSPDHVKFGPKLLAVEPEVLAVVATHRMVEMLLEGHGKQAMEEKAHPDGSYFVRSLNGHHSFVKMVSAANIVGRAVEMEVKVSVTLAKMKKMMSEFRRKKKASLAETTASEDLKSESAETSAGKLLALKQRRKSARLRKIKSLALPQTSETQSDDVDKKLSELKFPGLKKGRIPNKEEAKSLFERNRMKLIAGSLIQEEDKWDLTTTIQVGSFLIDLLLSTAKVPAKLLSAKFVRENEADLNSAKFKRPKKLQNLSSTEVQELLNATAEEKAKWEPAMVHDMVPIPKSKAKRYGAICCTDEIKKLIDSATTGFIPTMPYMPMLVKPRKWTEYNSGGHLSLFCSIMRTRGVTEQVEALKKSKEALREVFDVLDVLGSNPWKINTRVATVLEQLWDDGGNVAGLVDRTNEPVPVIPDEELKRIKAEDIEAYRAYFKSKKKAQKLNAERHSLVSDMKLKLEVLREFKDEERFFYPHNLDFRGRAYPMHPHLNHLGADVSRGVLQFADGKKLGPNGLRWLLVHLANLHGGGVDKYSFDGRVEFAKSHMREIEDSALRPYDGERWWMNAEDPFQFLATCMEITDAIQSGDPENFVSHLPVHQDGSCNGLQHYAALGRDIAGAESVNMTVKGKPADVYTGISQLVKEIVDRDAKNPNSPNHGFAAALSGHVDRKLVKQTVMTSVYGVTFVGARQQIHNRIKEKGIITDDDLAYRVACYTAKVTMEALSTMFFSARNIMAWLAECARLIAVENRTVGWVTPVGLPVVQPYRKQSTKQIRTTLQSITLNDPNHEKVAVSRQRSAFPPNFVHSLDSSHMMKTAKACHAQGIRFAGVHDSFWTHAADVDRMNDILRKEFFDLHSQPILEDLLESFRKKHPDIVFPEVPERGDLDLKCVLDAPYFFS